MGTRIFLAAALMLASGTAFAQHAFTLEPEAAPKAKPAPVAPPAAPAPPQAAAPTPPVIVQVPQPAPQPAPQVNFPSELDLYLVPAATHQVCTLSDWGFGEIRRDCRTEPVPVRRDDPALRGVCITRYGHRTCY